MEIRGAGQLKSALKKNASLDDVKNTVRLNGSEMHSSAMKYAPVDTRFLRRNIKYSAEDSGFTARVASEAEYAPYQVWGTRYQAGTPHVRPAYTKQNSKFSKDMKRLVKSGD